MRSIVERRRADKVMITGSEKVVMAKNIPIPQMQPTISTNESVMQIQRSQFNGQHVHTKLIKPVKMTSRVESVVNSSGVSTVELAFRRTTIKTLMKSSSALGIDFLRTCGMKFPRIMSLFGWKVRMNEGSPITNISRSNNCFGVNG